MRYYGPDANLAVAAHLHEKFPDEIRTMLGALYIELGMDAASKNNQLLVGRCAKAMASRTLNSIATTDGIVLLNWALQGFYDIFRELVQIQQLPGCSYTIQEMIPKAGRSAGQSYKVASLTNHQTPDGIPRSISFYIGTEQDTFPKWIANEPLLPEGYMVAYIAGCSCLADGQCLYTHEDYS